MRILRRGLCNQVGFEELPTLQVLGPDAQFFEKMLSDLSAHIIGFVGYTITRRLSRQSSVGIQSHHEAAGRRPYTAPKENGAESRRNFGSKFGWMEGKGRR
jgi:hypothetical protein